MEFIYFTEDTIKEFLRLYGKEKSTSKYYELIVAIILKRFCEKQWNTDCVIGFKLQDKYAHELPNRGSTSIEQIGIMLKKQIDKHTPIDVAIVRAPITQRKEKGPAFQLKRFGKGLKKERHRYTH